jgi:polysaccharide biosynthesis protein PslG
VSTIGPCLAVALALVAGGTACASEQPVDAAPSWLRVGLVANTLDHGPDAGAEQARVRQTGAGWIREEIRWNEIERVRGRFSWAKTDRVFREAARQDLRVLPLVLGTPRWQSRRVYRLPDARRYAAFTARVARRYGPGGAFWRANPGLARRAAPRVFELWNEPYFEQFSAGGVRPAHYARMALAAIRAGRRANPATRYLVSADTTYQDRAGRHRDWVAAVLRAAPALRREAYGLAVHPYTGTQSPQATSGGNPRFHFRRIADLRRSWGGAPRVWITELGWSTCPAGVRCVTEARQARYLAEAFSVVARERMGVEAIFVYHLRDLRPGDPAEREHWFGLRRRDGSAKPALAVLRRITGTAS